VADRAPSLRDTASIPADLPGDSVMTYSSSNPGASQAQTRAPLPAGAASSAKATISRWLLVDADATSNHRGDQCAIAIAAEAPTPSPPAPLYRLEKIIGRGGMGEVWQAIQVSLGRRLAVKRVLPSLLEEVGQHQAHRVLGDMRQEAVLAAGLEHPNILPVHDLGVDELGRPLIAMKLVEGAPWDKLISDDWGRLSPQELLGKHLPVLTSMAQAVAFAHDRGVVHRDLKPSQVMVGRFGEVLLMDWGLAISMDDVSNANAGVDAPPTRANASCPAGTPALMAPEQTRATAEGIGPHTDVFLLGGTLYYLLTGTFPYSAPTARQAFVLALAAEQERPEARAPQRWIPTELADLAMTAIHPEPSRRVPSATAFVDALGDYVTGASKRRESTSITDQARAALQANPSTYRALNEIVASINRAHVLWPENPAETMLRNEALVRATKLALASRDLTLARTQAEQISDETSRDELIWQVDQAQHEVARQTRQRRLAIATAIGLLVIVLVGGATFTWRLNDALWAVTNARHETELQRDQARGARAKAEDLVQFMLGGLRRKVAPVDPKLSALDEVAARAFDYYSQLSFDQLAPNERVVAMAGLSELSSVFALQGNVDQALRSNELNLRSIEAEIDKNPGDVALKLGRLGLLSSYGQLVGATGKMVEAREILENGLTQAETLQDLGANPHQLAMEWARLELEVADIQRQQGQIGEAIATIDRARERLAPLVAAQDRKAMELLANGYEKQLDAQAAMSEVSSALEAAREAVALRIAIAEMDPTDQSAKQELEYSRKSLGLRLIYAGQVDEGIEVLLMSRDGLLELAKLDPSNTNLIANIAIGEQLLAQTYSHLGRYQDIEAIAPDYLRRIDWLRERDPTNRQWSFAYFNALTMQSKIAWEVNGQLEPALQAIKAGAEAAGELVERDRTDRVARGFYGHMLYQYASMLDDAGQWELAAEVMSQSAGVYVDLVAEAPDHTNWRARGIETLVGKARLLRLTGHDDDAKSVREEAARAVTASMEHPMGDVQSLGAAMMRSMLFVNEATQSGELAEAETMLDELERFFADQMGEDRFQAPFQDLLRRMRFARAALAERASDPAAMARHLEFEMDPAWRMTSSGDLVGMMLRGRLRLLDRQSSDALEDARSVEALTEDTPLSNTMGRLFLASGRLLRAAAHEQLGDRSAALDSYAEAMATAPTASHRRELLDEWKPVKEIESLTKAMKGD